MGAFVEATPEAGTNIDERVNGMRLKVDEVSRGRGISGVTAGAGLAGGGAHGAPTLHLNLDNLAPISDPVGPSHEMAIFTGHNTVKATVETLRPAFSNDAQLDALLDRLAPNRLIHTVWEEFSSVNVNIFWQIDFHIPTTGDITFQIETDIHLYAFDQERSRVYSFSTDPTRKSSGKVVFSEIGRLFAYHDLDMVAYNPATDRDYAIAFGGVGLGSVLYDVDMRALTATQKAAIEELSLIHI